MGIVQPSVTFASVSRYISSRINATQGEEADNYFDTSLVLDAVFEWGDRIKWRPGRVNELRRAFELDRFAFDHDKEINEEWD